MSSQRKRAVQATTERPDAAMPPYWKRKKPSYWRRAPWHDYRARGIYMVTMVKQDAMPDFVRICADGSTEALKCMHPDQQRERIGCTPTELGECLADAIADIRRALPHVRLMEHIIMPDHVHLMLFFTRAGAMHLGDWVQRLKSTATRFWRRRQGLGPDEPTRPVFISNYHDRIIMDREQLERTGEYIADNPRRLWLKRNCRDFFAPCGEIEVAGKQLALYGNIRLLSYPFKHAVKVSRRYSEQQKAYNRARWLEASDNGEVLVSPCVHPDERAICLEGIARGGGMILIYENGFGPKYKPQEPWFDICAAGRLLIVGEKTCRTEKHPDFRSKALEMNATAAALAAGSWRLLSKA